METTLIDQGVSLMLYGMGTVFVFLTILVFATNLMSKVVNKLNPEKPEPVTQHAATQPNTAISAGSQPSPQIITAIEKAVAAHRAKR